MQAGDPVNRVDPRGRDDLFDFIYDVNEMLEEKFGLTIDEAAQDSLICKAFTTLQEVIAGDHYPEVLCELGTL
jgi:hypothetical protein